MNIIVIGTGMYVSGRGTDGYGTILPAITEWKRRGNPIEKVVLVGTNGSHSAKALQKAKELQKQTGVSYSLQVYPEEGMKDLQAYLHVLDGIEQPACAIVAVPDHLHYMVTRACLDAGLHTLVVKPLTPTVVEAKNLIDLAVRKKLYGMVEYHKRWDRQNLMLRDAFHNGEIGLPLYCWVEYSQQKIIPTKIFKSWVEKTNIFQYLGVHYIDIMRFVTGAVPVRVMAIGQKNWLKTEGLDVHDAIQCMVEWKMQDGQKFTQTILTNWIDPETSSAMSDQKIKLVGTKGRFESDQKERGVRIFIDDQSLEEPNPDFCRPYGTEMGNITWQGYGIESVNTFLDDVLSIHQGTNTPKDFESVRPTFQEAMISSYVLEAVIGSLENEGEWSTINVKGC